VYVKNLSVNNFRCFSKATIDLQFPGRSVDPISEVPNINLILGYNGGGKSSVLRALAISTLAPILNQSGFVPYYLVRRPDAKVASLKISVVLDGQEVRASKSRPRGDVEFIAASGGAHSEAARTSYRHPCGLCHFGIYTTNFHPPIS